ncbi:MAG: DUF3795 domain-containing protein [Promethearchaeota archaeon]|nr:MAG: DUF3795 domain-containing protein [Candidatus Lokiarchaeota archaeon]
MNKELIGMCGAYCGFCEWKEKTNCPGCQKSRGEMFWGECMVAKCSNGKGYLHCGFCPDLPCSELQQAFNNPDHGDDGERLANLKNWAKGDESIIKLGTFQKKD